MFDTFKRKIDSKEVKVGIIGLGYVGLPLAFAFNDAGVAVLGFDIDPAKIAALNEGRTYIHHLSAERVRGLVEGGRFEATTDFSRAGEADVLLLCVPTPLTVQREPDTSFIVATANAISPHLRCGQLVVLESTTYPGTTTELLAPLLEQGGLGVGKDFLLAYSPEREDPGNPTYSTTRIPKVVGGHTKEACDAAARLYALIVPEVVRVSTAETAEAVKLTENIFRCVNIALVNELKVVFDHMGIDIWEVIEAAKTKPFGYMPFYPGPGLGGHCIPIDPFYLTWKAREYGCATRFIELAGEVNVSMPDYVVAKLADSLNDRGKPLRGSRVLVVGIAYKKDVDDTRESPALTLIDTLERKGVEISYHDPYVPELKPTRAFPDLAGMWSVPLDEARVGLVDAVLITTAHTSVDYQLIVDHASLVIDTRNATAACSPGKARIVKA